VNALLAGILFPESLLDSSFFRVLATFVALNTTVYAAMAVAKILPKVVQPSWFRRGRTRAETRSIYPDTNS